MSNSFVCPFCNGKTPEDKKFCKNCGMGLHCPNPECKAALEVGAEFCVECGQPYHTSDSRLQPSSDTNRNEFDYYSNRQGRNQVVRATLRLSDRGMEAIAPFAFEQLLANPSVPPRATIDKPENKQLSSKSQMSFDDMPVQDAEYHEESQDGQQSVQPQDMHEVTLDEHTGTALHFVKSGNLLVPKTKDFKGTTWAEQQRNFILLYADAHLKIIKKPVPDKNHFKEAAIKAGVYDRSNFIKQVDKQINAYLMEVNGGLQVNTDGEKEIHRILALMNNHESKSGDEYWKRDTNATQERHRLTDKDKQRLDEWAKEDVDLGKISLRSIKLGRDYALVGYWSLTCKLKKVEAIHRHEVAYYLKKKYETVSSTAEALSKAVTADEKEEHFRKSGENHYLTTEAIALVDGWFEGKPISSNKATKEKEEDKS